MVERFKVISKSEKVGRIFASPAKIYITSSLFILPITYYLLPILCHRQLDYKPYIIGLDLSLVGCAISVKLTALGAFVDDNVSLFGIGLGGDGLHKAAALACAVTRVYIKML